MAAKDIMTIQVQAASVDKANISMIDELGRMVKSENVNIAAGANSFMMDCHGVMPGVYVIKITGNSINTCSQIAIAH